MLPLKEIESRVKKARVKLDLDTVAQSFYFWKMFTKKENFPLPPMLRVLTIHCSFWNAAKHGSDVKTAHVQKFKTNVPNNNLGAKAIDRMMMIIFSEVHRGTLMFAHDTEENLNSHTSLENFRNNTNSKMTLRQALNTTSAVLRN